MNKLPESRLFLKKAARLAEKHGQPTIIASANTTLGQSLLTTLGDTRGAIAAFDKALAVAHEPAVRGQVVILQTVRKLRAVAVQAIKPKDMSGISHQHFWVVMCFDPPQSPRLGPRFWSRFQ